MIVNCNSSLLKSQETGGELNSLRTAKLSMGQFLANMAHVEYAVKITIEIVFFPRRTTVFKMVIPFFRIWLLALICVSPSIFAQTKLIGEPRAKTTQGKIADKPLFRDPVYDGAADPVFRWKGHIWMVVDVWSGLSVYRSKDALTWQLQKDNLLEKPGKGMDDQVKGGHPDVVVSGGRAHLFYFTHPGRRGRDANKDTYEQRRSSIQVVELEFKDGRLTCDRDKPTRILLEPPANARAK